MTSDLGAGRLLDIRVGDAHLAETVLGLPLNEGDVLLNDRGFPRRVGRVAGAHQQALQLGRWSQTGARLQQEDGTAFRVDEWLESLEAKCSIAERPGRCVRGYTGRASAGAGFPMTTRASQTSAGTSPQDCRPQEAPDSGRDLQASGLGDPGEHFAA